MTNANPLEHDMGLWELQLHYTIKSAVPVKSTNPQHKAFVQLDYCTKHNLNVLPTTVSSLPIDSDNMDECQGN